MTKERTFKRYGPFRFNCTNIDDPELLRRPKEGHGFIYAYHFVKSGKDYIGQTITSIRERTRKHKSKTTICDKMIRSGAEFTVEILAEPKIEFINDAERYCIIRFGTLWPNGYNLTDGGQNYKTYTDEVKQKISDHHKRYYSDENNRKRMSRIMTEYYRRHPEKRNSSEHCAIPIVCLNTGTRYISCVEAERYFDATESNIRQSIKGQLGPVNGRYYFIYESWLDGNDIGDVLDCFKEWDKTKKDHLLSTQKGLKKNFHRSCSVRCIDNGMIFKSLASACDFVGCCSSAMSIAIKKGAPVKGYQFEKVKV